MEPEVTKKGALDMQVCVPTDYTNEQAREFAEKEYPCGTQWGWSMRQEGDPMLSGSPGRQPCAEREGCVHIMFDA